MSILLTTAGLRQQIYCSNMKRSKAAHVIGRDGGADAAPGKGDVGQGHKQPDQVGEEEVAPKVQGLWAGVAAACAGNCLLPDRGSS